jgi:Putative auto-transporter adhesin, head GIN domain
MKKYLFLSLFLTQSVFIFGQNNQKNKTERPDLTNFTKVFIDLSADVYIRQADSFRCRIDGAKRGLEDVRAEVKDGELSIYRRDKQHWFGSIERIIVIIEAPNFEKLDFSGVGKLVSENKLTGKNLQIESNGPVEMILDSVDYQHVSIDFNGVGTISIGGKAVSTTLQMNGTGWIDAYHLKTETANCETSGIGNISCQATEELIARVSGIGGIRYRGEPKSLRKSVSGIGRVVNRN